MKFMYLLVLLFAALNTNAQNHRLYYTDVDFRENQADTLNVKLDTILLAGVGSSLERIFLNDLSDKLIKDFASKKVFASYIYIGKNTTEAKENYKEINRDNYKAILLFFPTDTTVFDIRRITSSIIVPLPVAGAFFRPSRSRTTYEQSFNIILFRMDETVTKIWEASVDIDCEPGKKNGAKKLGNKILDRFKINKYTE
ncbi:hypothetical protein BH11BAC3_BH11BAC3_21680 [soil metagenome]